MIYEEGVVLGNIPMPGTSNHQYRPFVNKRTGKARFIPNHTLVDWKKEFKVWAMNHKEEILGARQWFNLNKHYSYSCSCNFYFPYNKLFTLKGLPKKMDVSNRLKALHDEISKILGIDDSYFMRISASKTESLIGESWCEITIKKYVQLFPSKK